MVVLRDWVDPAGILRAEATTESRSSKVLCSMCGVKSSFEGRKGAVALTLIISSFSAQHDCREGLAVLDAHDGVEEWVEGGGEEVDTTREVKQILVNRTIERILLEVDITQTLEVEWSPG